MRRACSTLLGKVPSHVCSQPVIKHKAVVRTICSTTRLEKVVSREETTEERVHRSIAGTPGLKKDAPRQPWVGYVPSVDSTGVSDWISFLSQHINPDTIIEDKMALRRWKQLREVQSYDPNKVSQYGVELAAATLSVVVDGKVKLHNDNHWYIKVDKSDKSARRLPEEKTKGLAVEAIDVSNTIIIYEGLEYFFYLDSILHLSLSNCKLLDEWSMSRLAMIQPLVSIDLSHNPYITERCLLPLQHLPNLRRLNLRGIPYFKSQPVALTMLEELLPDCVILTDDVMSD